MWALNINQGELFISKEVIKQFKRLRKDTRKAHIYKTMVGNALTTLVTYAAKINIIDYHGFDNKTDNKTNNNAKGDSKGIQFRRDTIDYIVLQNVSTPTTRRGRPTDIDVLIPGWLNIEVKNHDAKQPLDEKHYRYHVLPRFQKAELINPGAMRVLVYAGSIKHEVYKLLERDNITLIHLSNQYMPWDMFYVTPEKWTDKFVRANHSTRNVLKVLTKVLRNLFKSLFRKRRAKEVATDGGSPTAWENSSFYAGKNPLTIAILSPFLSTPNTRLVKVSLFFVTLLAILLVVMLIQSGAGV